MTINNVSLKTEVKSPLSKEIFSQNIQLSNFLIAKGVSDAIRTSFGPHGMDKVVVSDKEILITNDGATIMKNANFEHPIAKLLFNVAESQDSEVGDGTTSVVILSGSLLGASLNLIRRGISQSKLIQFLGVFLDFLGFLLFFSVFWGVFSGFLEFF